MGTHTLGNRMVMDNLDRYLQGEGWLVERCESPAELKEQTWVLEQLSHDGIDHLYEHWGPCVWVIDTGNSIDRAWVVVCVPGHHELYEDLYSGLLENEVLFLFNATTKKFRKQIRRMIEYRK